MSTAPCQETALSLYSIDTHFNASTLGRFWNIVGKGEIARSKQFLLFSECFLLDQKIVSSFVHIYDIKTYPVAM